MVKSAAAQGFSDAVIDCINTTGSLQGLLERLSDVHPSDLPYDINELTTAVRSIANAVRGVASVAQLEVTRNGL